MSAIDQAFIRAFTRQRAAPAATAPGSAGWVEPVHPPSEEADVDVPCPPAELPAELPTELPADDSAAADAQAGEGDGFSAGDFGIPDVESPQAEPHEERPVEAPGETAFEPDLPADPDAVAAAEQDPVQPEDVPTACDGCGFEPSLQVDGFVWPSGCTRLSTASGDQIDQLADALTEGLAQGQHVLAISACHRADGCTTLLLCVAQSLARRGLKIALVDADTDNPLLAQRLGLVPEAGWEAVLAGRLPLGEVTIESIEDRIAVLPLCVPLARPDGDGEVAPDLPTALGLLREHYDLVLVDLGEFTDEKAGSLGGLAAVLRWIDAVVLVHNVRSTSPSELEQTRQRIEAAGLAEAGIVENFADVCPSV